VDEGGNVIMLSIILGVLVIVGVLAAVVASIGRTPDHLRGYYGAMFWTIAIIAIVGVVGVAVLGLL
jgi:hypothetical protein